MFLEHENDGYWEGFRTKKWKHLSVKDRMFALQYLEHVMARIQRRNERTVFPKLLKNGDLGCYDDVNRDYIFISSDYLKTSFSDKPWKSFEAMRVIIHEGRHSYQHDCFNGRIEHFETNKTITVWKMNSMSYFEATENFSKYYFQPLEFDANNYTNQMMTLLSKYYGNNSTFTKFLCYINEERDKNIKVARENFGLNFLDLIFKEVIMNHEWNNRYIPSQEVASKAYIELNEYASKKYGKNFSKNREKYIIHDVKFRQLYRLAFPNDKTGFINILESDNYHPNVMFLN